jgi:transcriptional regulator with XRE-family HTH domain
MDWKSHIAELLGHGLTQQQIAAACGCRQSTISQLATGETKDPRYSIGESLRRLLDAKRGESAEEAEAATAPANGARAASSEAEA